MKTEGRLFLAGLLSLILISAVWAVPPAAQISNSNPVALDQQQPPNPPPIKAANGTISKVEDASFTITLPPSRNANSMDQAAQQDTPVSMTFLVDKNTTIEGKLVIGSNADVTYHDDPTGNHVAVGVRVTPPKS